ncbi:MYND Zn-finger protein [Ceratobasidium sp. AG-Ba]|nr:MYND Zn-finger protein [Ceratobasidium sp. AG-Ba]
MMTALSLSEVRDYWLKYAAFADLPTERLDKLREEYEEMSKLMSGRAKEAIYYGASRSAANLWTEAAQPMSDQFGHYWEHGTTATTAKELKKITKPNPTFYYSPLDEYSSVYMNTFPQGYHFAPAFTPLISDPAGLPTNSAMVKAKQQFKAGLTRLQLSRQAKSIVLRFFVGDVLALCRALDQYAKFQKTDIGEFTTPWRATTIDLSEHAASSPPAPNVERNTSTLGQELGIFNILLLDQPSLKKRPASQAVLYTDISLPFHKTVFVFHEWICHSVVTSGILIGLAPRHYLSMFTSISNTHELIMPRINDTYMERIAWVDPTLGDSESHYQSSPKELLQLLFGIYDTYFSFDRLSFDSVQKMGQLGAEALQFFSTAHYSRKFMVAFLVHIKSRSCLTPEAGWDVLSNLVAQALAHHSQKPQLDLTHEFGAHHLLRGLPFKKLEAEPSKAVARSEVFNDWTSPLPKLARATTLVFGEKLNIYLPKLKSFSPNTILRKDRSSPFPRLVCNIIDPNEGQPKTTAFESVQGAWGKCTALEGSDGTYIIKEGSPGFRDDTGSDLILSFWVNSEHVAPTGITVSLSLHTPLARYQYRQELGESLTLFSAGIADKDDVLVLKNRPTSSPNHSRLKDSLLQHLWLITHHSQGQQGKRLADSRNDGPPAS